MTIQDIFNKYSPKLDLLDLELIIVHALKKPREFVLAHTEARVTPKQEARIKNYANRRRRGEPLAYILGHKEFYGLDFIVDRNTLIPRPETELLVDEALDLLRNILHSELRNTAIVDVGTGAGNIIISVAKAMENFKFGISNLKLTGIDTSSKALKIARQNAEKHSVAKKIKFFEGNLLDPIFTSLQAKKIKPEKLIILANLPYLSQKIYDSAAVDVKKYEPRSALFSANHGLAHYEKLLKQIKELVTDHKLPTTNFLEISPEQKPRLQKIIQQHLPIAKVNFHKDLAGRWRVCQIEA